LSTTGRGLRTGHVCSIVNVFFSLWNSTWGSGARGP